LLPLETGDGRAAFTVLSFVLRIAKPEQAVLSPGHVVILAWERQAGTANK
jgi:hypothetical protein